MPFLEAGQKMNPFVMPAITGLEDYASNVGIGKAGKWDKKLMQEIRSGDYSNLAGTMLSPIHDRYATNLREALRSNSMGANAFMQGWQPALMAAMEQETRGKMAEGEGLAYGQAIPELWNQASSGYQTALNQQENAELAAREAAMRGRLAGTITTPSVWDKIQNMVGGVANIAKLI